MRKIVIAIDGFSSCGKSTMAKDLAREVGYIYVDTGAMYRSVTLYALRNNLFDEEGKVKEEELISKLDDINICFKLNEQTGRPDTYLNGERVEDLIRSLEVSQKVSPIAAIPAVREKLVKEQQKMGEDKGIVMDGRGMPACFDDILKNIQERDYIDSHRATSPLRQADDALVLDNSNMTIAEQKEWLKKAFDKACAEQ